MDMDVSGVYIVTLDAGQPYTAVLDWDCLAKVAKSVAGRELVGGSFRFTFRVDNGVA